MDMEAITYQTALIEQLFITKFQEYNQYVR